MAEKNTTPSADAGGENAPARRREGIGSSSGRVLAALRRSVALKEGQAAAPASEGPNSVELELAHMEEHNRLRKDWEEMFEERARALEDLLGW